MLRCHFLCAAVLLAAAPALAAPKAAIFPFELNDVSIEGATAGPRADETRRLTLATEQLRRLAARDAGYDVLDLAGLAAEIDKVAPLYKCNGCEVDIARRAGAQVAITGYVRKVSSLILQIFITVRDVENGKVTGTYYVDIKGNTDETWRRGVRWLVVNRLAADKKQ